MKMAMPRHAATTIPILDRSPPIIVLCCSLLLDAGARSLQGGATAISQECEANNTRAFVSNEGHGILPRGDAYGVSCRAGATTCSRCCSHRMPQRPFTKHASLWVGIGSPVAAHNSCTTLG